MFIICASFYTHFLDIQAVKHASNPLPHGASFQSGHDLIPSPHFSCSLIQKQTVCSGLSQGARVLTTWLLHSRLFHTVHCQVNAHICPKAKQIRKIPIRGKGHIWEKLIWKCVCCSISEIFKVVAYLDKNVA